MHAATSKRCLLAEVKWLEGPNLRAEKDVCGRAGVEDVDDDCLHDVVYCVHSALLNVVLVSG